MPKKSIIISAGGIGKRMGAVVPKQFLMLKNEPILMHTIRQFYKYDNSIEVILILPSNQIEFWKALCKQHNFSINHQLVKGGKERFHSVKNGLEHCKGDVIGVHDAVRPLVALNVIENCFDTALQKGTAIPVLNLSESVRLVTDEASKSVDRRAYRLVQTPQCFQAELLKSAYNVSFSETFTDDASVVEHAGTKINLVKGNDANIKITRPLDLKLAEVLLNSEAEI